MIGSLRKKAEEFAIQEASGRATEAVMKAVREYVVSEMKKIEDEFAKMGNYINGVENMVFGFKDRIEKLERKVAELEKENKDNQNKLQGGELP